MWTLLRGDAGRSLGDSAVVAVRSGAAPVAAGGDQGASPAAGVAAGVDHVHAHRWRHTFAHEWKLNGGNEGDLMLLMGWTSDEMPRRYGQARPRNGRRNCRPGSASESGSDTHRITFRLK